MTLTIAALVIGLPAILLAVWPLLRPPRDVEAPATDDPRVELEAEKVRLLRLIRELDFDRQAGHMAETDYVDLRTRHEARAGAVLRQLDLLGPTPPERRLPRDAVASRTEPVGGASRPVPSSRQPLVLAGAGVGLVVFGVLLGVLVVRFTGPDPTATMGSPPGPMALAPGGGPSVGPGGPAAGGERKPLAPGMLAGMLQAARASLEAGRMEEAISAYQAILKREPNNVDALTHFGLILAMAGHADRAVQHFDRALAIDPDYPEALSYSAQVRYELKQDYAGAIAAWERFAKIVESEQARNEARSRIEEARARLAAAPAGAATPAPPAVTSPGKPATKPAPGQPAPAKP